MVHLSHDSDNGGNRVNKIICIALLFLVPLFFLPAQDFTNDIEPAFEAFADSLASALPFASTLGLNWSDAYIGQFPHFGIGVTVGAVGLPAEAFGVVFDALSGGLGALPVEVEELADTFGMPFPAAAVEARIGGFGLPFDIGLKAGFIPEQVDLSTILPEGLSFDYMLLGADVRFNLVKEKGFIPDISIGGGYNYLAGGISMAAGEDYTISDFPVPDDPNDPSSFVNYNLVLANPVVGFSWESSSIDLKAQISKQLLFITPYVGVGATYGWSKVNGGVTADLTTDPPLSDAEWQELNDLLALLGEDELPELTSDGFFVESTAGGFAPRAFAGLSIDLFFLRLDVTGQYEFTSGAFGASANVRLQF